MMLRISHWLSRLRAVGVGLTVGTCLATGAAQEADPTTLVFYNFADKKERAKPAQVHPAIEAGPLMQPVFFPPTNRWFDGSEAGEAGEAIVKDRTPEFYEVTVAGLEGVEQLDTLSFDVTTRKRQAGAGHVISIAALREAGREQRTLSFDLAKAGDGAEGLIAEDVEQVGVGEAGAGRTEGQNEQYLDREGKTGTIVVDLSELDVEKSESWILRINFDHSGQTAIDNVKLTGHPE